jgi:tetratricopeptide (TPR) repeat protein
MEGNVPLIKRYNARLLENAMHRNNPVHLVWYYEWAGSLAILLGEWDKALEVIEHALKVMEKTPVGEVDEFILQGIQVAVDWHKGNGESALKRSKQLLDRAVKMQVVDYSIYIGFFHFMDVIFLGLEQAFEQNRSQAEKDKLMKYANLALKIMKIFARVFTTGRPVIYRYKGWIEWYSGKKEKGYQFWRTACEKAHSLPMNYEEGMAYLALANHLPAENSERAASFEKAKAAFVRGGFDIWVDIVQTAQGRPIGHE